MGIALALLGIFGVMAVLMYLNRLSAIVALPIMATYAMSGEKSRPLKRLYDRKKELVEGLRKAVGSK